MFSSGTLLCLSRVSAIMQIRAVLETKSHTHSRTKFCRCVALSFQSVKDSYVLHIDLPKAFWPMCCFTRAVPPLRCIVTA